ncbi:MAG: hypothetical protein BroJett040_15530 [Oligoflexia bacterium]|nr:MAG: hypothetical protein BroJett040_15530 [Oligoflexia bacterium]
MLHKKNGFTLFEVLIVIAILGAVLAIGLPRFNRGQTNIKKIIRELGALSKEVRHYSRLKNTTHRIVFDMEGSPHQYWVEVADGPRLVRSQEKEEAEIKAIEESKDSENKVTSAFRKSDKLLKDGRKLPDSLQIKQVEVKSRPEPITKGKAYVHFTAEGLVDQAVVQITDGKQLTWSLIFNPLTGHADIVEKPVSLKDLEVQ